MKKVLYILLIISLISGCTNKQKDIKRLFAVEDNIDKALQSRDAEFINTVIDQITEMEQIYPEHRSLKESKYTLQIRLRRYDDAIVTIDSILALDPDDIDHRIIQGILLEIKGHISQSILVWEEAYKYIEIKLSKMLKEDQKKLLGRKVNRVLILKLLSRDTEYDYDQLKNDEMIKNHPEILELLLLLERGSREQIINNYR